MNPYVVSVSGTWPNERYVYNINPSVIDYRFNEMPVNFLCAPYYSEDHNFAEFTYTPPKINDLVGLSSNSVFFITQNNLEFNVNIIPNLTFSWSPSSLRKQNKGNVFGTLMLNSEAPTYYGASVYPSQLFLYPLSSFVKNSYSILTSNNVFLTAYDDSELTTLLDGVTTKENLNQYTVNVMLPVSTVIYSLSSAYISSFYIQPEIVQFLQQNTSNFVTSSITFNGGITSVYYVLSSDYLFSERYTDTNVLNNFLQFLPSLYSFFTLFEEPSSIAYNTLIYQITSQNFVLQTSTVLLKPYEFQFADWQYGKIIKQNHNAFLSNANSLNSSYYQNNIELDNVMYELSGSITYGRRPVVSFFDDLNPTYYKTVLDPEGYKIRPDTVRLEYNIEFYDYMSQPVPFIRGLGDQFDDLQLYPDRHIDASYILKQNDTAKTLTFQLLQSSVNTQLALEDTANCVLSAILNFDTSKFEYFNTAKYVYTPTTYGVITPVSGVRNSDLALRYMSETPYIGATSEAIDTTLLQLSSVPGINLNSPVDWSTHNRKVDWVLKYPPYYYSFKNSYKKTPSYNYENKNSLNFYLSSTLSNIQIVTDESSAYAEIDLYNSVYSDFDILELPLSAYGVYDLINFRVEGSSEMFNIDLISAFLVVGNDTVFYDISSSPYVPAVSGAWLKLKYDLRSGGTIISLRPSLSTLCGPLEAYWATTFPVVLDYGVTNYIRPIKIETLNQDLSSLTVSVRNLSGGENTDLDLTNTYLIWSCTTNDIIDIQNLSLNNQSLQKIKENTEYLFEDANTIKITGITNQSLVVSLSSQEYNSESRIFADPDYFNIYAQNYIKIVENFSNKKNKIKKLGFTATVPYFTTIMNLPTSCAVSWTWEYDNIAEFDMMPVSAYADSLFSVPYKYGSIINQLDQIYFLIDTDYTLTEIFKLFKLNVEIYDRGKIINGQLEYPVNSYPDSSVVSTDFTVAYDKFPNVNLLNTSNQVKTLTRPPNGTNIYKFTPQKLQTNNVSISTLEWQIDSSIVYNNSTDSGSVTSTVVSLSTNAIGDYETVLVKNFNLYDRIYKDYYNLEYLNGNSLQAIVSKENLNNILNKLSVKSLTQNNSYLSYLSSSVSLTPTATSLYVITTAKYISSFDTPHNFTFLDEYNNLYSTYYYTSTISILSGNQLLYTYNNYVVDFWLSSANILITDNYSLVESFSSNYINNNPRLLYYTTEFNLTTSLSYGLSSDLVRTDLYYYNTIYLKAQNVNIPGWETLYDFEKSAKIIITNQDEFNTSPVIFVVPRFSWVPGSNKKANRFLQILDIENNFSSYFYALSGKTYTNKKTYQQEYDLVIKNVQDISISSQDQLTFVFSLGDDPPVLLADQLINSPNEYIIPSNSQKDVLIKNMILPYHPELLQSTGANLYVTAFNKFFPVDGGITYLGMDSLTANELSLKTYPITAVTQPRNYDQSGSLTNNLLEMSPRLFEYEPCKLLFYPKLNIINLDDGGLIQVKQILETNPSNSPNIINYDLSTVTYTLSSDYWVSSITIPAISSATINLFNITVGNASVPLQISDYTVSNLVISASARVATKIMSTTFDKITGYVGETDLWETVYQDVIGNAENSYKFLNFKISTGITNTGTITSSYYPMMNENNWILVI